jgi:hypothetical protein
VLACLVCCCCFCRRASLSALTARRRIRLRHHELSPSEGCVSSMRLSVLDLDGLSLFLYDSPTHFPELLSASSLSSKICDLCVCPHLRVPRCTLRCRLVPAYSACAHLRCAQFCKWTDILTPHKPSHAWHSCMSFRTCLRRTYPGSARPCHARGHTRAVNTRSSNTRRAARLPMPGARCSLVHIVVLGTSRVTWIGMPTLEPHAHIRASLIFVKTKLGHNAVFLQCHTDHRNGGIVQLADSTVPTETKLL